MYLFIFNRVTVRVRTTTSMMGCLPHSSALELVVGLTFFLSVFAPPYMCVWVMPKPLRQKFSLEFWPTEPLCSRAIPLILGEGQTPNFHPLALDFFFTIYVCIPQPWKKIRWQLDLFVFVCIKFKHLHIYPLFICLFVFFYIYIYYTCVTMVK